MDEGARIRRRVAALGARGRGIRVPADLRREIGQYAGRRRGEGIGVGKIGKETGVSGESVRRWRAQIAEEKGVTVLPVRIRPEVTGYNGVVIHTAGGHRVTGLDVEGAVRLLRGLG